MTNDGIKRQTLVFIGIDVGSSYTKSVAIDSNKKIIGCSVKKSGVDFQATVSASLDEIMQKTKLRYRDVAGLVSTGYGRKSVNDADYNRTEIGCHAKGCFYYFPFAIDVIDIGGQDNKIIKIDKRGRRTSFKMNRKCAAGTGAFLEEMSPRLNIPVEDMNRMAESANGMVNLGSFCTVFSATEVLENIRLGKDVSDIVKGIFFSVLKRVMEMDSFLNQVVITGGVVAHNPYLIDMAKKLILQPILVPKYPQLTGALGAALYAMG